MTRFNRQGGVEIRSHEDLLRAKKADLITLPKDVTGTNCFNCKWIKNKEGKVGYCSHPKVAQDVSERQCCANWDNSKTLREFGRIDSKYT